MITFESWDRSRPAPTPKTERDGELSTSKLDVDGAQQQHCCEAERRQPALCDAPRAQSRGEPRSVERGDEQRDGRGEQASRSRTRPGRAPPAGRQAGRRTCPAAGAAASVNVVRPARRDVIRRRARSSRVSSPVRSRRSSHAAKAPSSAPPARIKNGTTENPNGVISSPPTVIAPRGSIRPHSLLFRIPNTASPRPAADSATPIRSSCGGFATFGAGRICLRTRRIAITITTRRRRRISTCTWSSPSRRSEGPSRSLHRRLPR
jgi:hypothetical protein